jgi:GGDEF domain-containing protein
MDPETGAFAADHFEELVREAVTDAELQRAPRPGDGPSPGGVALISIRRLDLDPQRPLGPQMAILVDRLQLTLRLDDTVGRLSDDTIGVLLRGCPPEQLLAISRRCTGAVEDGDDGPVRVLVAAVHGTRDDARALIETILLSARPSTRSRSPA